ncbi:MAG: hypothetical protein QOJ09_583 [Actinomycetota bacterium]|nr:hypothetical protein [Actinomycetota bacterium]
MLQPRVIRVLLVDDEPDIRTLFRLRLRAGPFEVVAEAIDGLIAITLAEITRPDVILLDIDMPALDGLTAIHQLRRVSPASRIVVCSSGSIYAPVADQVQQMADGYIDKVQAMLHLDEHLMAMLGSDVAG